MAASLSKKLWPIICRSRQVLPRFLSDSSVSDNGEKAASNAQGISPSEQALGKFGKLVETVAEDSQQRQTAESSVEGKSADLNQSFATMLRKSKLVGLGEDMDKRLVGKIIEVMEDDLYIDFGGKFHCVCQRPRKDGELYQRGTEVIVNLKSQEMSSAFLGSDVHITLLEADAVLLGLREKTKTQREVTAKTR